MARHWNVRRSSTFIRQVVTAVVVGVATIFVPKTVADEHWSTPPTVLREEDAPRAAAGGRLRDS